MRVFHSAFTAFTAALLFLSTTVGCDDIAKQFGYVPAKTTAPSPARQGESNTASSSGTNASQELTDAEIDSELSGNMSMARSSAIVLSGDMRPRYIVSGHIKNDDHRDLKMVRVRIIAHPKDKSSNDVLDTAEFEVTDIPAYEAKAFRREVPLLVPEGFRFEWTILSATAKP